MNTPENMTAVMWQTRRRNTVDGEWMSWKECDEHLAHDYAEDPGGTIVREFRTLFAIDQAVHENPVVNSTCKNNDCCVERNTLQSDLEHLSAVVRRVDREMWAKGTGHVSHEALRALSKALEYITSHKSTGRD